MEKNIDRSSTTCNVDWCAHKCDLYKQDMGERKTYVVINSSESNGYCPYRKPQLYPEINESWRLPTKEELNDMYENLHKKGVGGFANDYYWSSSEYYAGFAWFQNFFYGLQLYYYKDLAFRVRAVRTFKSNEEYCIRDETNTGIIFWKDENSYKVCKPDDEQGHFTWNEAMDLFKENHGTKRNERNKIKDEFANDAEEEMFK